MNEAMKMYVIGNDKSEIGKGAHRAKFQMLEYKSEGEHGPYFVFTFQDEAGTIYKGFADDPSSGPNPGNKFGRFLCGLAGKPETKGESVDPRTCVGQNYLLNYATNKNGKVAMSAITKLDP